MEAAQQSIVLLENDGVLPLVIPRRTRLGVVGKLAFDPRIQGIGSSQVILSWRPPAGEWDEIPPEYFAPQ